MGRQAFITRLALGRSPFQDLRILPTTEEVLEAEAEARAATESGTYVPSSSGYVQRYDCRGHPQNLASEYLREESRRAQNKASLILSQDNTGRATQPSENSDKKLPIDPAKINDVVTENYMGLFIDFSDQALSLVSCICLLGVRQRLQTFQVYTSASLCEVLKSEWIHFGLGKVLFAGFSASFLNRSPCMLLRLRGNHCDLLAQAGLGPDNYQKYGAHASGFSATSQQILQNIVVILLTPLEIHAIRQRLDLIPMWPSVSPVMAFIQTTYESFFQNLCPSALLNFDSCAQSIKSLILSPFAHWYIFYCCKRQANLIITHYLQFMFPRPENPDMYSLKAAVQGGCPPESVPGLGMRTHGVSRLIGELKWDFWFFVRGWQFRFDRWKNMWARIPVNTRKGLEEPVDDPGPIIDASDIDIITRCADAEPWPSAYEKRIRFMQKKMNIPVHRVTILNGFPASTLSRHLARHLSDLLFIPLESLLLRSIAGGFLSSPQAHSSSSGAQSCRQILPLGTWFGLGLRSGGWKGVFCYAGKIALWWGFEVAVGYCIWQLHAGIVWWLAPWAKLRGKSGNDQDGGGEKKA